MNASVTATEGDPGTGTVLDGRYRLERTIGRGGMGRVYQATHLGLGRPVAIKVLEPLIASDEEARRRFEREAQATGRLRNPHCVGVTDFGTMPDGSPYLVMELVQGTSLEDVLGETPRLPVARALHILRGVLRGLAHAHAQGLVHRDLKPANIMLVTEGEDRDHAKILDFGLARLASGSDDRITRTGIVCGTPRYMSPEQVQDRAFDARADLYAASVILFELLTGATPFDSEEPLGILKMHLTAEVPRIAEVAPDVLVPPEVEALIRRGLAKRPEDRPASAEQYLAELDRAAPTGTIELSRLESVIVPAPVPPPIPRRRITFTRAQRTIGIAAAAVLAIGVIAAIASHGSATAASTAAAAPPPPATAPASPADIEMAPEAVPADATAAKVRELARTGRGQEAVSQLRELRQKHPDDAQIAYALGRVYHRLGWPGPSLDAYSDALHLDGSLRDDPDLIADLVDQLASLSLWQVAARILQNDVGAAAVPALTDTAAHSPDATVRSRAAKLIKQIDGGGK